MKEINNLVVKYHDVPVGILAETKSEKVAFQYHSEWLAHGFSISPFSLPLENKVFIPSKDTFDGLFGVFSDSLPDGWGRLLVDRFLLSKKISPVKTSVIQRLGIVGATGMGALEYHPELIKMDDQEQLNFDRFSLECEKIMNNLESDNLDQLFQAGGSSGGARPKAQVNIDDEPWLVKFPSSYDRKTIGTEEYHYLLCAGHCKIQVPETKLFSSELCDGYFGVKRFDRRKNDKIHMITVSGLLETSHRIPNLDYMDLIKLTYILTKDNRQVEEMYRRMCFNVYAHNRDDHSKNFSYLYNEEQHRWILSPAYDLTYSNSIGGEHATCINGNGRNPGLEDLLEVGKTAGLSQTKAKQIAAEIYEIVQHDLGDIIASYSI